MIYELPEDIREGLAQARRKESHRRNRLRVRVDDEVYPIVRLWRGGFSLDAGTAPNLRGRVDIYDGARHLYQCLVICSMIEGHEKIYEFKRQTAVTGEAPLDYVKDQSSPVALLG